jgi:hypothetical protein
MTGFMNNKFLLGFLLARDLGQQQAFVNGIKASQYQGDGLLPTILDKQQIDKILAFEAEIKKLKEIIEQLQQHDGPVVVKGDKSAEVIKVLTSYTAADAKVGADSTVQAINEHFKANVVPRVESILKS